MSLHVFGILAQVDAGNVVTAKASAAGMPGAQGMQTMLNWLMQIGLWGSLAALLGGGALWGLSERASNTRISGHGRQLAMGGAVGAFITGLAPAIVTAFAGLAH